jgi:hypothetical protein
MPAAASTNLRLAVIGTPRSGNSWVRVTLERLFELEPIAVHRPDDVDWDRLPPRCVIQLHWYPRHEFVERLERSRVRVVVPARHPLDVLVSWLNLAVYSHLDGRCDGPDRCEECPIVGSSPRDDAFLRYVAGEKGRVLLNHSPAWWDRPEIQRVRYESLVEAPQVGFGRLIDWVGEPPRRALADVLEAVSIDRLKPQQEVWQFQLWQGRPGIWRRFLPPPEAHALAAAVPDSFQILGYTCDPDPALDSAEADRNWLKLQLESTRENLALEREKHRNRLRHVNALQAELAKALALIETERQSRKSTRPAISRRVDPAHSPVWRPFRAVLLAARRRMSRSSSIPTARDRIDGRDS